MSKNLDLARECGAQTHWDVALRNDPELADDDIVFTPDQLDAFAERIRADCHLKAVSKFGELQNKAQPEPKNTTTERLLVLLAHAVKEADGWHDDSHGGAIAGDPLMDEARAALAAQSIAPVGQSKTGWPPGMLQDDSRQLSGWLASRPDARRLAREGAPAGDTFAVPPFSRVAAVKMAELQARGLRVVGYALRSEIDGQVTRCFIDHGGFVGWWRNRDHEPSAPEAPADKPNKPPIDDGVTDVTELLRDASIFTMPTNITTRPVIPPYSPKFDDLRGNEPVRKPMEDREVLAERERCAQIAAAEVAGSLQCAKEHTELGNLEFAEKWRARARSCMVVESEIRKGA